MLWVSMEHVALLTVAVIDMILNLSEGRLILMLSASDCARSETCDESSTAVVVGSLV